MKELLKFYMPAIFIFGPTFFLIVRLIFKKSIIAKMGYILVVAVILATIITFTTEYLEIPSIIVVFIRLAVIFGGLLLLKKDIGILSRISGNLKDISEFNLVIEINEKDMKRKDELGDLSVSLKMMKQQLEKIVAQITMGANDLDSAGEQLSAISQQISQSTNEQAATAEEVATSMEQMLAMTNSNTKNAQNTGNVSTKSAEELENTNKVFLKTLESISEISKKTSIISEIAEKTDILSINAAIEAARAGETGKGFAVVAVEIRKLADKTKIASDEISKLSKSGQDISKLAVEKFQTIIPEILKSAELVLNIVSASKEQQTGIESINISMQQLTEITNENSASAEEMSASAEELSVQAEHLKEIVSIFKIEVD